jgi:hypothetical protein
MKGSRSGGSSVPTAAGANGEVHRGHAADPEGGGEEMQEQQDGGKNGHGEG